MRRPFVTVLMTSSVVALALLPAAVFAQNPPAQQQPAPTQTGPSQTSPGQPGAAQATPQAEKKEPRLAFSGDAGILLFQIKPDQTAVFEELVAKVKESLAKSDKPERKQQLAAWKLYKSAEPMAGNALYVFFADPAIKGAEYDLFMLLSESPTYTSPEVQEFVKKAVTAFSSGANRLNLTPVGAGASGM